MKFKYNGTGVTVTPDTGEKVGYRLQRMDSFREVNKEYTWIKEAESVTLDLNKKKMECVEVKVNDEEPFYLPPEKSTGWRVRIICKINGNGLTLRLDPEGTTPHIHLSHFYFKVEDGTKTYLSANNARDGMEWEMDRSSLPTPCAESYCEEFLHIEQAWG